MINTLYIVLALIGMALAILLSFLRLGKKANWLDMAIVAGWMAWAGVIISIYEKFGYKR